MSGMENKIQLIVEAVNNTKPVFTELTDSLKGLQEGAKQTALTYQQFVSQRMGQYMKELGGHGPAIRKIAEEWKEYKKGLQSAGEEIQKSSNQVGAATKNLGSSGGTLAGLKENWLAITAAIAGTAVAINKAFQYMEQGAKAQQAEESFRAVAAAAGESADEIIEAMKRASNGTIDDSAIMQKAVKGMVQGLSGDQMVNIMEAARMAARVTGQDISTTYETITDAIGNKLPRTLIQYGLITKQQMKSVNEAVGLCRR